MSDYLWDRTGSPDPEIVELERVLAPLGLKEAAWPPAKSWVSASRWAIAACLVAGVAGSILFSLGKQTPSSWELADSGRRIMTGERVRAGSQASTMLESAEVGRVELAEGAEVRVMEASASQQRLELSHGKVHVLIWAPPGKFVVDTPSARAVDLGCQYELSVDGRGDGFLRVQTGWVAFQTGALESFIPAGAACRTTRRDGPGIPYFEDAPEGFRTALERFEQQKTNDALETIVSEARREDGVTLWHLLTRVSPAQTAVVFDRFSQLVPLPSSVSREKALSRDRATLDLCWNALNFSDADWWRVWKRDWR